MILCANGYSACNHRNELAKYFAPVVCFQDIFHNHMLLQFINVLFQALVYRSHDLLQEEITITIYNMASVDFEKFYLVLFNRISQRLRGFDGERPEI